MTNYPTTETNYEKAVVVIRKTLLEELIVRFTTAAQARFYLESAGQDFSPIQAAHDRYHRILDRIRALIPKGLNSHVIDRDFLPSYAFNETDIVVAVGQDGLVVNTAKYLSGQPMIAVNPDPESIDGVLLPYTVDSFGEAVHKVCGRDALFRHVTMAEARLQDDQRLLGFNDLFIGAKSHVSAHYQIAVGDKNEEHSSSGIIISTGAGSTGWLRSVYAGAVGVVEALGGKVVMPANGGRLPWDSDNLVYSVREPFPSKATQTNLIYGLISSGFSITITSKMAENGIIFSDGVEQDYLSFNAGATATIGIAKDKAVLIVPS